MLHLRLHRGLHLRGVAEEASSKIEGYVDEVLNKDLTSLPLMIWQTTMLRWMLKP